MTKAGFWLNATIGSLGIAAFVVSTGVFGYKWLAHDEANRAYGCGSGSRGGTCFIGETTNMVLTLVFGALATAGIVLFVNAIRSYRRRSAPQAYVQYTTVTVNGAHPQDLDSLRAAGMISDAEYQRLRGQVSER